MNKVNGHLDLFVANNLPLTSGAINFIFDRHTTNAVHEKTFFPGNFASVC